MEGYSVFVYAYRVSLGVSERQPNPQFTLTLSLARAVRFQADLSPLSVISLWLRAVPYSFVYTSILTLIEYSFFRMPMLSNDSVFISRSRF